MPNWEATGTSRWPESSSHWPESSSPERFGIVSGAAARLTSRTITIMIKVFCTTF